MPQVHDNPGCWLIGIGGVVFAAGLALVILPEWRANYHYVRGTCVVLDKRIGQSTTHNRSRSSRTYRPEFHIRYRVAGSERTAWTYDASGVFSSGRSGKEEILQQFQVGSEYPCWYDPAHPDQVVLVRGWSALSWILTLVPFTLVVAGLMVFVLRRLGTEHS